MRWGTVTLAAIMAFFSGVRLRSQSQPELSRLQFEVASVKPSAPGGRGGVIRPLPGNQTYIANNIPLRLIMTVAYTVTDRQISGGPDWIANEPYDITAKAARPGTTDELHRMLQQLLEDRFHLKVRHEMKEAPVYALTVDKGGPRMPEHDPADLEHAPFGNNGRGGLLGRNVTMNYFAFMLSRLLDRSVIDKTGLTSVYDVDLHFARDFPPRPDGSEPPPAEGPNIFTAVREQLGLKLESTRGPVEHLVIEHVERPAGN